MRGIVKGGLNDGGGSNIKSIQRGTISFGASDTSKTVTISSVDTTKTIVRVIYSGVGSANMSCYQIILTNNTTITISKNATQPDTVVWIVEEYNNVKSLQTGSITPSSTPQNVTISPINPAKSLLVVSWEITVGQSAIWYYLCNYTITDATTITFTFPQSNQTIFQIAWQLIEFN